MKYKIQLLDLKNINKKNVFTFILFCVCCLSHAQKMKNYVNKELTAKVGIIYEETPDDNPCAGSEIYLTFLFDKKQVQVSEKEVSTCGKESIHNIGTYTWELLCSKEIKVDFIAEQTKGTYAENIVLELRDKQLIGNITHLNGKVITYTFKEKTND